MKGKKILKISLGVLGSLVLLILIVFFFFLGPTVKFIAQTIGSNALGTPLSIEKLSISPTKGVIHLTDFTVANHDIFGQSNAVSLASLDIEVDVSSLFSSTVVVHRVDINSPHFVYEQSDISDNISEFVLKVQEFAGIDPNAPPPPPDPKKLEKKRKKKEKKARKKATKPPKILIVESLAINDVLISFVSTKDELLNFGAGFESFSVSMTNGNVQLDNLYVSNPGRLATENLFHLEEATLEMVPGSIYSSNITINAVGIKNPHIFIEHNPETDTVGEFLKIASGLATKIPTNKASATNDVILAETTVPTAPPPNLALESLILENLRLNLINTAAPELNMAIGLERLNVALERGDIRLDNLYIGNPESLQTPHLFLLEQFAVQLRPGSHIEETVVIEEVQINHPHVTLELHEDENTVVEVLKIAKGYTDRIPTYQLPELPPPAEPKQEPLAAEPATNRPPVELYNLAIDDIQIQLLNTTDTNRPATDPSVLFGIREVAFNFFDGQLGVRDIMIPNADGFTTSNLFHLANIDVKIQPDSINSPQFIIDEIFVDSPKVNLEQTEESGNVAVLQTELMKFAPDPSEIPTLPSTDPEVTAETALSTSTNPPVALADQPVVLHQLVVTNFAVNLKFPVNTNDTEEAKFGFEMSDLNPMDAVSKLNPNEESSDGEAPEETEVDPDSAMTILAFELLSLEPLKGLLYVNNMRISNPPNFSRRNLIQLDQFRLDLDPDTLQSDTLLIEDVQISKPSIRYERQIRTDNIKALQAEIEQAAVRRGEQMGTEAQTNQMASAEVSTNQMANAEGSTNQVEIAETADGGQKVIIEHLLIHDGIVRAKLSALPAMPIPLPTIEREGMGKEEGGTSLADASTEVFNILYDSIIGAVGNATGLAGDTLKGAGALTFDAMGNIFGGIGDGISNVAGDVKDGTQEIVEEVKEKRKKSSGAGGRRRLFR